MKEVYILFCLIILNTVSGIAQNNEEENFFLVDSLDIDQLTKNDQDLLRNQLEIYHSAQDDTSKLNAIVNLIGNATGHWWWEPYNNFLLLEANEKFLNSSAPSLQKKYLFYIGFATAKKGLILLMSGYSKQAAPYYEKSLEIRETINDVNGLADSHNSIGLMKLNAGEPVEAIDHFEKAISFANESKDYVGMTNCLSNLASAYNYIGRIEEAVKYHFKTLELYTALGNEKGIAMANFYIGLNCFKYDDIEEAMAHFTISLDLVKKINFTHGIIRNYIKISELYLYQKDYQNALEYANESIQIAEEINHSAGIREAIEQKGNIYLEQNELDSAAEEFQSVLELSLLEDHAFGILRSQLMLGETYLKKNKPEEAKQYLLSCYEGALEIGKLDFARRSSALLSEVYLNQGDYLHSLEMLKESNSLKDSLSIAEAEKEMIQRKANLKLVEKEAELLARTRDLEILRKSDQIKNLGYIGILAIFSLVIALTSVWFKAFKRRKKIEFINVQNELILRNKEIDRLQLQINQRISNIRESSGGVVLGDINRLLSTPLSKSELKIMEELILGKTNIEISESLFISVNTVKTHLSRIYTKLDVKNRTQAVKIATNFGALD